MKETSGGFSAFQLNTSDLVNIIQCIHDLQILDLENNSLALLSTDTLISVWNRKHSQQLNPSN